MSSIQDSKRNCPIWKNLLDEANQVIVREPNLKKFFTKAILGFSDIESSISYVLADQLQQNDCDLEKTQSIIYNALISESDSYEKISTDINTVLNRDPACITTYQPILFFKGFSPSRSIVQQIIIGKLGIKQLHFTFNQEHPKFLI